MIKLSSDTIRIGHGFDMHAFGGQNHLVIGGVCIPFGIGVISHSDGDVLIHAVIDALLGASSLGDIGTIFPDNNPSYKGISSMYLLNKVWNKIQLNWHICNIDITFIAQKPKISSYIKDMKFNISKNLEISETKINIKATTTEKLGFLGKVKGVACEAVVLLSKLI